MLTVFKRKITSTSTEKLPKYYKTLESILMFNYYKVDETGDLRYLLKLSDYDELPDVNVDHLADIWDNMRFEVEQVAIDKNKTSDYIFKLQKKILENKNDFDCIQLLLPRLWEVKNEEYIKALSDLGYRINPKRDYHI